MLPIANEDIGGAKARRTFTMGGRRLLAGDELTGDEVRSIPFANRLALIDSQYIDIWPKPSFKLESAERFVVRTGHGKYNVVAGVKVNDEPLSLEDAQALAASSLPQN